MNERAPGQTLARVIAAHGGFGVPVARARRIMGHVARALVALNEAGIVYGALCPSNIFIEQDNATDLASLGEHGTAGQTSEHFYFAPERSGLSQAPPAPAADVFSFAAILYEILSGTHAFARGGSAPSLARTAATLPAELRDRPDIVAALDVQLARALTTDPAARHPSVDQLWLAVDPLLRDAVRPTAGGERFPSPLSQDKPASVTSIPVSDPAPAVSLAWQILGPPMIDERLHASILVEEGRAILAAGTRGLYRLVRGVWSRVPLPAGVDARSIRGLARLSSGDLLLFGEPDFCVAITSRGTAQRISLPDRDVALCAAYADDRGVVFVGQRLSRPAGAVVILPRGAAPTVHTIEGTSKLTDVTRLTNGTLVAVGLHGAIVEFDERSSREVSWARSGHLHAVTAGMFGAAHAVGSGGHAVRIEPSAHGPLVVTLERVQTTRDLCCVAADFRSGAVWAAGSDARLMQRVADTWARVPLDPLVTGRLLRVHLQSPRVIVVVEDGATYEASL